LRIKEIKLLNGKTEKPQNACPDMWKYVKNSGTLPVCDVTKAIFLL